MVLSNGFHKPTCTYLHYRIYYFIFWTGALALYLLFLLNRVIRKPYKNNFFGKIGKFIHFKVAFFIPVESDFLSAHLTHCLLNSTQFIDVV